MAEIHRYIARDNPAAAQNVLHRILEVAEFVAAHPGTGHATVLKGVRAIPANPYPYVLYFRGDGTGVRCCVSCMPRRRPMLREEPSAHRAPC
ncbi:MAG: type II toxin-antitoxin system RelE/ParE family toxin [Alphaproteobacteria bacterium]|nr:type II toxin-antitoxin system RelE/ParE family toxin [Alphaproteobacteria bacterium]